MLTDRDPGLVLPGLDAADLKVAPLTRSDVEAVLAMAPDVVLVDGAENPRHAANILRAARDVDTDAPLVAIVERADLEREPWADLVDDLLYPGAPAAEIRVRLARALRGRGAAAEGALRLGPIVLDRAAYRVSAEGRALDLTFKEFELLRYLAEHVGRVFTRPDLLREVWGYGYYGGTRTVDVHIRRLRAKLGPGLDGHIETVRGVGYRAVERPAASRDDI